MIGHIIRVFSKANPVIREIFGHNLKPVEILVFANSTGCMLTSCGLPFIELGTFNEFLRNDR